MTTQIQLKSYNQYLGNMVRKVVADTPLNDLNVGSVILRLLEACATNDFDNGVAILNLLELLNIDSLKNSDLDNFAASFGITRRTAVKASNFVTINDSSITKRSTSLFPIKTPPISGSTKIFVTDASQFNASGQIFIGRGTNNFEGPISYTSIVDNGTFYTINLGSALQKNHLISDTVVDGQGTTDRVIGAGSVIFIPANNQSPRTEFAILRKAVIPAGEDKVENVEVVAQLTGTKGNAGVNQITEFSSLPFAGATVTNASAFTNGRNIETDDELRNRVKVYAQSLARGTNVAITSAILGQSDSTDNKQVDSAVITEPVSINEPAMVYIDDGTGFQPSFDGQTVDKLLKNATGQEKFLQLANFPVPRPQIINTANGPYELTNGMILRVRVDDEEEEVVFTTDDFVNISSARLSEIVSAINDQATIFKARLTTNSTRLLIYPDAFDAEIIQVTTITSSDDEDLWANDILKFPTNEASSIKLYKNNTLLKEKEKSATLVTTSFANWNVTASSNIIIAVDGTPSQDRSFTSNDFAGVSFNALTLDDWVEVFNTKFAGLQAEALSSGKMKITSNRIGDGSSISVLGGSLLVKWFADLDTEASGQTSNFLLNKQNGNIKILTTIEQNDEISAGVEDAKGFISSLATTSGTFNLATDTDGKEAELIAVVDSSSTFVRSVNGTVGTSITLTDEGNEIFRMMSDDLTTFQEIVPTTNDYLFVVYRDGDTNWFSENNTGLFKVVAKGDHTTAGVDSYVDVYNPNGTAESKTIQDVEDIQAFYTDGYPQLWSGSLLDNPATATLQNIVDSLNVWIENLKASIFKTNKIKITSTTELNGSISLPVVTGNATLMFSVTEKQVGNAPHVANKTPETDLVSYFKRTVPADTWLDRTTYTDIKGTLDDNVTPGTEGIDSFAEIFESSGVLTDSNVANDDLISFTNKNNEGQYRFVKQLLSGDRIGTGFDKPRTTLNYVKDADEFQILEALQFSSEDTVVMILDDDSVTKSIDVAMARTGIVNSGSQSSSFLPTGLAFSANDFDNESGVDFGTPQVWSKELNDTEFANYKMWFRARNWYETGGVGSGIGGKFLVRAKQYGPAGETTRFALDYPSLPSQDNSTVYTNNYQYNLCRYIFGSDVEKTINVTAGTTIDVTALGDNNFRYAFSAGVDLSSVVAGDIFSALTNCGISADNRGQFKIKAVDTVNRTIDVYNPNGSATTVGDYETTKIVTVGDIVGSKAVDKITTVADVAGSLNGKYFTLYDSNGSVAFWFDINNAGTPEPTHGCTRSVEIYNVVTGDSANNVASKITSIISADPEFNATVAVNEVTVTNYANGLRSAGTAGTTTFTMLQIDAGTDDDTLDGSYITMYDVNGSVAFWFDITGSTVEPGHGKDRSVKVSANAGEDDLTIASRLRSAINSDSQFSASVSGNEVTATDVDIGNRSSALAGTTGFTVSNPTNGSLGIAETITVPTLVKVFALKNTTVDEIVAKVNEKEHVKLVAIDDGSAIIDTATREEVYTPGSGYSSSLAYGHNPDPSSGNNDHVKLYDSETWVLNFKNTNPNFTLKNNLVLVGVAPSIYSMDTAVNNDITDTGELFKLIPTTLENLKHQLTHKALSQLSIVTDVDIASKIRGIQVKSLQLGSDSAIEIVGGRANSAEYDLIGEAQLDDILKVTVDAFPDSVNPGDNVKLQNVSGVNRLSRLASTDSIDVVSVSGNYFEYRYNPKTINFTQYVRMSIADISATYSKPAGTVWRWTHHDAGTYAVVTGKTNGVAAASPADWIADGSLSSDFLNEELYDIGTVSTKLSFMITVNDMPTQADYWTFQDKDGNTFAVWIDIDSDGTVPTGASYVAATNKIKVGVLSTDSENDIVAKIIDELTSDSNFNSYFTCTHVATAAILNDVNEGDVLFAYGTLAGWNTGNKSKTPGTDVFPGFPIISVNATSRYVDVVNFSGAAMTDTLIGSGTVQICPTPAIEWYLKHSTSTRYKIEPLKFKNLCRLSWVDGDAPYFLSAGVAVDDILVISGNTFNSNNSGTFRIRGVDETSILYENSNARKNINTDNVPFNDGGTAVTWTQNSDEITGSAGNFTNLSIGDAVKKPEDTDSYYVQVLEFYDGSLNPTTAALAVIVKLNAVYRGTSAVSEGVCFDQSDDVEKGVYLDSIEDVRVFEGDRVQVKDSLFIMSITNSDWFNANNIGTFEITHVGTSSDYKPYVRVVNENGVGEVNRLMSVKTDGFILTEHDSNKFDSIRKVNQIVLDEFDDTKRVVYLTPSDRMYKFSESNGTKLKSIGKLNFLTDAVKGTDGYLYYTGLLRKVQRLIDGFEPDIENYPARKAVGSVIEILPPLIKKISLSIVIATKEGVNLGDISNEIKSAIINYVNGLGVGNDVVLSKIVWKIMQIRGVDAVTFKYPSPTEERVYVADMEKAFIELNDISIA
jgi:hypothetical protein